jgi:hypothetical protein
MLKSTIAVHFTFSVASKRVLPLLFYIPMYYGHFIWNNILQNFLAHYIPQIMVCMVVLLYNVIHR